MRVKSDNSVIESNPRCSNRCPARSSASTCQFPCGALPPLRQWLSQSRTHCVPAGQSDLAYTCLNPLGNRRCGDQASHAASTAGPRSG
eukprot:739603-Pleurochrysis_carterae.AAC.1